MCSSDLTKFYNEQVLPTIDPASALAKAIKADLDYVGFTPAAYRMKSVTDEEARRAMPPPQARPVVPVTPEAAAPEEPPAPEAAPPVAPIAPEAPEAAVPVAPELTPEQLGLRVAEEQFEQPPVERAPEAAPVAAPVAPVEQAAPQEAPVAQQGREDVGRIISMTKAQYREDPETRGVSSSSAMQIEPAGKTPKQLLEQYGERDVRLLASLYGITVKDKNTVAKKLIDLHNSLQELGQYTAANLRSLTLAELKPLAKENGIQPVGTKEEIIRRILAFPEQTRLKFEDRLQDAKHTTALDRKSTRLNSSH